MREVDCTGSDRQTSSFQHRGILLDKPNCNLPIKCGVPPQFQDLVRAAFPDQVRAVRSDQIEPSFIEKLTQASCTGSLVFRVCVARRLYLDNSIYYRFENYPISWSFWSMKKRIHIQFGKRHKGK